MTKKLIGSLAVFSLVGVFSIALLPSLLKATTIFSDDFTGTTINVTKWTENDSSGIGGTTGNVQQNGNVSLTGNGTWGSNYLVTNTTFDRGAGDISADMDVTISDCAGSSVIPGLGYGDPGVLSGGGESYTVYYYGGTLYFSRQNANSNAENTTASFTCTNNTPFHLKITALAGSGAKIFINNSGTAAVTLSGGTFTNKGFFLEGQSGTTIVDNFIVSGAGSTEPDAPTSLGAIPGSNQMLLNWTAPGNNGGSAITNYLIEYKLHTDSSYTTFSHAVSTITMATVTGLTNGLNYDFRVSAVNSIGTSTPSSVISATPALSTPSVPRNLSAQSTGSSGQVRLSWDSPLTDGGASTTDYLIEYKLAAAPSWTIFSDGVSQATTSLVTGLTDNSSYNFRVSAINSVGTGSAASFVTATPGAFALSDTFTGTTIDTSKWNETDPGAIGGTVGKVIQNGNLNITGAGSWSAQNGLTTVQTYDRTNGDVSLEFDVSKTVCGGDTGTVAVGYGDMDFTAAGSNSYIFIDNGSQWEIYYWSNGSNQPSSPIQLSDVTSCTNNVPITFRIVVKQSGGAEVYANGSTSPSAVITGGTFTNESFWFGGLSTAGNEYYDNVRIQTPAAAPTAPINLAGTAGDNQVSLTWTAPDLALDVAPITDYVIQYRETGGGSYSTFSDGTTTSPAAIVTGLSNGICYDLRVAAINSVGTGAYTSSITKCPITSVLTAPSATNVSISGSAAEGEVLAGTYTFSDPNNDTESGSMYRWLRSDTLGGSYGAISGATASTYTLTSSDLNKYIKFEVTPVSNASPTTGTAVVSSGIGPVSTAVNYYNQILSTGQSLSVGIGGAPALTTTQPYSNKMLTGGGGGIGQGTSFTPLVESSVETMGSALANTITSNTNGHNYDVVMSNSGVSGYTYAQLKKGTSPYAVGIAQTTNIHDAAVTAGRNSRVVAFTAIHGETDNLNGVTGPTYEGYLVEWQHDLQTDTEAITGQTGTIPFFTDQMSSSFAAYAYKATSSIPIYQLAAAEDHPGTFVMVAPKYYFNYSDLHHLTNESYRWLGEYYGKVIKQVVVDHQPWRPLSPDLITRSGNVIYAKFHVPAGVLALDTTIEQAKANYGFEYFDDAASASISSVQILNSDTVKVTLSATPTGGNQRLRYAYTGTVGVNAGSHSAGASGGNLRDTDPYPSLYGNTLYNWAVMFDKPITLDNTAPALSSIVATPGDTSANISWTSDETATSQVEYGLTSSYAASTTLNASLLTSHSVSISSLISCTQYHYRILSSDAVSNQAATSDATFSTNCVGSAPVASSTSQTVTSGAGGTISFGNTTITIPSGYSSTTPSAIFQVKSIDSTIFFVSAGTPGGMNQIGNYVLDIKAYADASTTVSTFDHPISLTLSYDPSVLSNVSQSSLVIYRYDNGTGWTALTNCTVDTNAHTITCQTNHFSNFSIFGVTTVTPSQGGGTTSGGGGGSGYVTPAVSVCMPGVLFNTLTGARCPKVSVTPASSPSTFVFTTDLQFAMSNAKVKLLQQYLNTHGFIIAPSGPGSPGKETTIFGYATKAALVKFQKAKGITPASGLFGPLTRAYVSSH
jgi:hypothetical protein